MTMYIYLSNFTQFHYFQHDTLPIALYVYTEKYVLMMNSKPAQNI